MIDGLSTSSGGVVSVVGIPACFAPVRVQHVRLQQASLSPQVLADLDCSPSETYLDDLHEWLADLDYSPSLLLLAPWSMDMAFVRSLEYARACQDGFETYLDELHEWDRDKQVEVLCDRVLSWVDLLHNVIFEFAIVRDVVSGREPDSLAQRAGFVLGWLSAYAFRARQDADLALGLLAVLVEAELQGRRIEYSLQSFLSLLDAR